MILKDITPGCRRHVLNIVVIVVCFVASVMLSLLIDVFICT